MAAGKPQSGLPSEHPTSPIHELSERTDTALDQFETRALSTILQ